MDFLFLLLSQNPGSLLWCEPVSWQDFFPDQNVADFPSSFGLALYPSAALGPPRLSWMDMGEVEEGRGCWGAV